MIPINALDIIKGDPPRAALFFASAPPFELRRAGTYVTDIVKLDQRDPPRPPGGLSAYFSVTLNIKCQHPGPPFLWTL